MEAGVAVAGRSSFRKPAHAPSQRNYRRRSPSASSSRSSSSSRSPPAQASSGGWKRDRSGSPSSPKRAVGTNASASLQPKKGRTSHTGKDGSDEDSQGRLAEHGPGPSERQGQGRGSYDRHSSKHDYHDYSRRSSTSHYDRSYNRSHGRHSNRDSGDGRRNGDHNYGGRSSRRSPERGYRDTSWNRDRERHRSRDRGRDSEGRVKYRGESRSSYLERDGDVGGKIDQDFRQRDRDREKDRIRDHEKSRRGRSTGRDGYSGRGDDSERRYDENRDSKRDRDRDRDRDGDRSRDRQRSYKSRWPTREDSDDGEIEAGEFGRERSREREKIRDAGKEREREKLQTKSSVRDVSSSNHVDRKQAESSDEEKFQDNSGTNDLDGQLDPETQGGGTWESAREGSSLKERAEEKESRGFRGSRTDMDQDAERFGEKARGRYVEPGTNRDHFDRRKERTRQGDEDNTYKGRDVTGKEQFNEDHVKDVDAWTESSVLRNKDDRKDQDLLSEDDEFVTGQTNHIFSNRPDDGRSGTKAISTSDHGSYRDKDRGSSSGLDKASASDRCVFDETTDEKERAVVKSDGQQGNKAKQVGASLSFEPKDKEGSKIRNHAKGDQEKALFVSSLPSSTASDSDRKVIAGSAGKGGKSSKWGPETSECSAEEVANDLNAAKLAAMKAAELVNKNLGLAGFMSADQKKRLLWGSKKSPTEQETAVSMGTNRWDTVHFSDPDRQEKFHKLMGVKADTCAEPKKEGNPEVGVFTEEKQRELQHDLEKQFAAGLRRRDGGKVGLGL